MKRPAGRRALALTLGLLGSPGSIADGMISQPLSSPIQSCVFGRSSRSRSPRRAALAVLGFDHEGPRGLEAHVQPGSCAMAYYMQL